MLYVRFHHYNNVRNRWVSETGDKVVLTVTNNTSSKL